MISVPFPIITVTGTNGKTSITHFVAEALTRRGARVGVIGTLGAGRFGHLSNTGYTTPDAPKISVLMQEMIDDQIDYLSMEVSSHALVQGRVDTLPIQIAVFTNLTQDHLDYHKTMEAYGQAKARLFTWPTLTHAVINLDDPWSMHLLDILSPTVTAIGYTLLNKQHARCQRVFSATDLSLDAAGMSAHIAMTDFLPEAITADPIFFKTDLLGQFNLSNLLAAWGVLTALAIDDTEAALLLSCVKSVSGRLTRFGGGCQSTVFVDYAHTPDALAKVLGSLRPHCQGELYCVMGCGGDRDAGKRPLMAAVAEQYADHIILTDDNPRHEDPKQIMRDILAGFSINTRVIVEHDRELAIEQALRRAKTDDMILIAGKGHETVQIIGDIPRPFNDADVVRNILAGNIK